MTRKNFLRRSAKLIGLFVATILIGNIAFEQTQSIIVRTSLTPSQLNSNQLAKFNRLSGSSLHDSFQIVQVQNLATSQVNGKIRLALSYLPCNDLIFTATKVDYTSENDYYWYGIIDSDDGDHPCKGGSITLMAKGGEKFGAIVFDDYSYEFQDLGNGIQTLSRFKLEAIGENECGIDSTTPGYRSNSQPQSEDLSKSNSPSPNRITPCNPQTNDEVRVLVLWTQAAANIEANINNRIALGIAQTNQTYLNSQVGGTLNLVLAGSQQINFVESNNPADIRADVNRLGTTQAIQALRNQFQADLVVLLTNGNYGRFVGIARDFGPSFNDAYAIVQTNAATGGRFTFAHEVGHLFGCRHDDDPNGTIQHGYTFRTGWFIFTKQRYTLLAVMPSGKTREQNYSNPDVFIKSKATGTTNHNNNAQQHRNTAAIVANFFANQPVNPPMAIDILQNNPNVCCTTVTAEADVFCGTAPYYFNWKISYDGINWQLLPNSEIVTFNTDCDKTTLIIELAVTDAKFQFQVVRRYYNADCGQMQRMVKTNSIQVTKIESNKNQLIQNIFPNPTSATLKIELNPATDESMKIDIIDALGVVRKQIITGVLSKGKNIFSINTAGLQAGIYRLRVNSSTSTESQQFLIVK